MGADDSEVQARGAEIVYQEELPFVLDRFEARSAATIDHRHH